MNKSFFLGISLCAVAPFVSAAGPQGQAVAAPAQQITRAGEQAPTYGSADYFTGRARVDPLFSANEAIDAYAAYVTFEPGARTAWHTHPLGQTLIVTQGRGWLQEWGKAAEILNQGDIAWIPPGVKHWHGASAQTAMTHIAIAESVNGSPVAWLEKVTDEQYPNG